MKYTNFILFNVGLNLVIGYNNAMDILHENNVANYNAMQACNDFSQHNNPRQINNNAFDLDSSFYYDRQKENNIKDNINSLSNTEYGNSTIANTACDQQNDSAYNNKNVIDFKNNKIILKNDEKNSNQNVIDTNTKDQKLIYKPFYNQESYKFSYAHSARQLPNFKDRTKKFDYNDLTEVGSDDNENNYSVINNESEWLIYVGNNKVSKTNKTNQDIIKKLPRRRNTCHVKKVSLDNILPHSKNNNGLTKKRYIPLNITNISGNTNNKISKIINSQKNRQNIKKFINVEKKQNNSNIVSYINNDIGKINNKLTALNNDIKKNNNAVTELVPYINNDIYKSSNINNINKGNNKQIKLAPYGNNNIVKTIVFNSINETSKELAKNEIKNMANELVIKINKEKIHQITNGMIDLKTKQLAEELTKALANNDREKIRKKIEEIVQKNPFDRLLLDALCISIDNIQKKKSMRRNKSIEELGEYYSKFIPLNKFKDANEFVHNFIDDHKTINNSYKISWYNKQYEKFTKYMSTNNNNLNLNNKIHKQLLETLEELLKNGLNADKNIAINDYYDECIQSQIKHYINTEEKDMMINDETNNKIINMKNYFIDLKINTQDIIDNNKITKFGAISFPSRMYVVKIDKDGKKKSELVKGNSIQSHISHLVAIYTQWKEVYSKYKNLYDSLNKMDSRTVKQNNKLDLN